VRILLCGLLGLGAAAGWISLLGRWHDAGWELRTVIILAFPIGLICAILVGVVIPYLIWRDR
jgi:hypothetical protein